MRRRRRGFTLIEIVVALAIAATALVALQAATAGAILSAGDAIYKRAAREAARAKLEEILAGSLPADGGGTIEDRNFTWTSRSEEIEVGLEAQGRERVRVVTLTLTYPTMSGDGKAEGLTERQGGRETITLSAVMPPEAVAPAPGGGTPPG